MYFVYVSMYYLKYFFFSVKPYIMENIYLVVFVDNQLELADSGLIFKDKNQANSFCEHYSKMNQMLATGRECMVRSMKLRK